MSELDNPTSQVHRSGPSVLRVGNVLDSRYEIVAYLGCGGMGSVYKARHVEMDRDVAIKVLHARYYADPAAVKRFQREAQIISNLRHANILSIYSFSGVEGLLYLAMEFVQGKSLGRIIEEQGRMPHEQAVPLLRQICAAMSHAHQNNVLHRDLKPDNVMVVDATSTCDRTAKVVDFGLAKVLAGTPGQRLTKTGEVVGDPRYMSPEQCKGETLDARSDVYSFGCLMYELLTGKLPFDADDPVAIMHKQLDEHAEPFAKKLGIPEGLEAITLTAMAKDRQDRYEDFAVLDDVLKQYWQTPEIKIAPPPVRRPAAPARRDKCVLVKRDRPLLAVPTFAAIGLISICGFALWANAITDPATLLAKLRYYGASEKDKLKAAIAVAEAYQQRGDTGTAEAFYKESADLAAGSNDTAELTRCNAILGNLAFAEHRQNDAQVYYSNAFSQLPEVIAASKANAKEFAIFQTALRNYATIEPSNAVRIAHNISDALITDKAADRAQEILLCVADKGPKKMQADTLFALAKLNLQAKRWTLAQRYMDRAVKVAEDNATRMKYLKVAEAEALVAGDHVMAAHYLEKQLCELTSLRSASLASRKTDTVGLPSERQESNEELQLKLGIADCYFRATDYPRASKMYESCIASSKHKAQKPQIITRAYLGRGQSEFNRGNYMTAVLAFREATMSLAQDSEDSKSSLSHAYWMLGNSLTCERRYGEAEAALLKGLKCCRSAKTSPDSTEALKASLQNARLLQLQAEIESSLQARDYPSAERAVRKQIELLPESTHTQLQLAQCTYVLSNLLRDQGRHVEAARAIERAEALINETKSTDSRVPGLRTAIKAEMLKIRESPR